MPDLTDQLRIAAESPELIKARLLADTNAGIDPNDPNYADTVPGSIWDDLNGAMTLELDRTSDRLNEVVAAAIPSTSFGTFLDAWALSVGLERKAAAFAGGVVRFSGTNGTMVGLGTPVSTVTMDDVTDPVTFTTTASGTIAAGILDLPVIAEDAGSIGNVAANTVTILDTPVVNDPTVTNQLALTGGDDIETDERLQERIVRKLAGVGGPGNRDDYINWALNWPGVGFVTVQSNVPSLGHVTVVITDINNDPMPAAGVDGLQEDLDPSTDTTQGAGTATIGATVVVSTPTTFAVAVVANNLVLTTGYSLDGAAGTINVSPDIEAAVAGYVNRLPVGGDVIHSKTLAAIVDVIGVEDLAPADLTLNGSAVNLAVSATQVASLTTPITLSL